MPLQKGGPSFCSSMAVRTQPFAVSVNTFFDCIILGGWTLGNIETENRLSSVVCMSVSRP